MLIIPAIDLLDGRCVRLSRGDFSTARAYADEPAETARAFAGDGALWIHVVDLDAARGRGVHNRRAIAAIRAAVACRLEVGGGVRTEADADELLGLGVDRLILGSVLARAPGTAAALVARFGPCFIGGIDAAGGAAKVSGWEAEAGVADEELARGAGSLGLRGLVYTSITRDGTLAGPDIAGTNRVARAGGLPTVLSGGIGSHEDVEAVRGAGDPLVVGVIVGKAIYERKVVLRRLVEAFQGRDGTDW